MKILLLIPVLLFALKSSAQFTTGIGYELSFLKTDKALNYTLATYNENETYDYYRVTSSLNPVSQGIMIRSFGGQFFNPKKISFGYSLEIGYRKFSSQSKLLYLFSSTTNQDSIVKSFKGVEYKTQYQVIRFKNFLDFHWNITDKMKFTNSIGIGLNAIIKTKSPTINFDGSVVNTLHPILNLSYQPQITEKYEKFSISYFASFNLYSINLFRGSMKYQLINNQISYTKIKFTSIGIRINLYPKLNEILPPLEEE